jgi:hypothetical protein
MRYLDEKDAKGELGTADILDKYFYHEIFQLIKYLEETKGELIIKEKYKELLNRFAKLENIVNDHLGSYDKGVTLEYGIDRIIKGSK